MLIIIIIIIWENNFKNVFIKDDRGKTLIFLLLQNLDK